MAVADTEISTCNEASQDVAQKHGGNGSCSATMGRYL